jgi:hypothetical protein
VQELIVEPDKAQKRAITGRDSRGFQYFIGGGMRVKDIMTVKDTQKPL